MNQQEQEFLREKQKILKSMPDSVAFSREEAIARVTELNKDNREYPELD